MMAPKKASAKAPAPALNMIGEGTTRHVWSREAPEDIEETSPTRVVKQERTGPNPGSRTHHEFRVHTQVLTALARDNAIQTHASRRVEIPILHGILLPGQPDWEEILAGLPRFRPLSRSFALVVEKVLPLPLTVREILTGKYSNGSHPGYEVDSGAKHCMVRPYLGQYTPPLAHQTGNFNLRNMPLSLTQIQ
ncbi:hypothetical protein B0H67DRAFT_656762 [Lasiosphaeris hirsuta]|uniref:Uncharacterized protein n=1 Tax=Lasiosphaeris hirsuta TaxID=260670 RepID=A0AA40E454_9PEZI|nr:hypothetical protein B0H67DRAFT_656762 [Lasiosphaeris hirsuta]